MDILLPGINSVDSLTIWGLGTMGRTWVVAALSAGFEVYAHEPDKGVEEKAIRFIEKALQKIEKKDGPEGLTQAAMDRLHVVSEDDAIKSGTPIHLEVIPEDLSMKIDFFENLGPQLPPDVVIWSNTSCLDVEKMAMASGRPKLFIGAHGMNPVHLMKGVEVIRTDVVDPDVFTWTMEVLKKMGKTPFPAKNVPGFIVNKLYVPLALETIRLLFRREADTETIDQALKLSLGHPQGGLLLADRIGHDVMIDVADELFFATQDPRYTVPQEYREMVEAGNRGSKSGQGFYNWADPRNPTPVPFEKLTVPVQKKES